MKVLSLTTTLLTALSLTAFADRHTVKSGDTVSSISRKHKVSVSNIMKWNKITDPTKLRIGQSLNVSSSSPKKSTPSKSSSGNYKVAKGDTFYSIARRHKISVSHLRALNPNVSTNLIAPGQSLAVSGKAPVAKPRKVAKKTVAVAKVSKKPVTQKKVSQPAPAPKKISTATTLAKKTADPAPEKETAAVFQIEESMPISTPPAPPVVEDPKPAPASPSPSSVASVILTDETTFDAFASKHGTNTSQLNALNGWNLPKATVLARGSEIYVPQ